VPSEAIERKLAATLSADAVGYSRLMAEDEAATIRTLTDYREAIAMLVRQHRGRVVDSPGDNVLAEFPTALDAVRCAVEIQGVLKTRNANLPPDRRMEFRIGVHMGDLTVEGGRVYGDGVNIAARLEGLAEPGGICISATVHDQVRNKLEVDYDDLGDQTVKNIPDQVRVYRVSAGEDRGTPASERTAKGATARGLRTVLLATGAVVIVAVAGVWATWPRALGLFIDVAGVGAPPVEPALPENPSIAVLPFTNLSGDPEQEYFSDGITEDLTTELARDPLLFVISRNSAFLYKGKRVSIEQVGRELGVRYVLEGSVRRAGDRVRITAQLIDSTTGGHLWGERYDRDLSDIFALQSEIASEILGAVGTEIGEAEAKRVARKPTANLTAMDAFWRGMYHMGRTSRTEILEARRLFERAIDVDPAFAPALAGLAGTYTAEFGNGWNRDPELLERAEDLARRGINLDPSLPDGHVQLAFVSFTRRRPAETIAAAERAIELAPNLFLAHALRGMALAQSGRFVEGTRSIKRALRLNPRAPSGLLMMVAYVNFATGRRDEAITLLERVRGAAPDNILARIPLAAYYEQEGRHEDAQTAVREILEVTPDLTTEKAMELIPGLEKVVSPVELAQYPDNLRKAGLP
jgi:adenylate cyclase